MNIKAEDLFCDLPLVNFVECMRDVVRLKDALDAMRDAALRGTSTLDESRVDARTKIMLIAQRVLVERTEQELNNALEHARRLLHEEDNDLGADSNNVTSVVRVARVSAE
jgi:hypothetical protein